MSTNENKSATPATKESILNMIAQKQLGIESLSDHKSDWLDSNVISIADLHSAMAEAFAAGYLHYYIQSAMARSSGSITSLD